MGIPAELEWATVHASPQEQRGRQGDNQQRDNLLPVHRSEHNCRPRERNLEVVLKG